MRVCCITHADTLLTFLFLCFDKLSLWMLLVGWFDCDEGMKDDAYG
jgi:hypothetical protein